MIRVTYKCKDFWQRENRFPSIPSFSQSLDEVLGNNGLKLSSITEVLGLPGTGKTQLCLQLCTSVLIPRELGGLNGEALYIDTNHNFTIDRFKEVLKASLSHIHQLLNDFVVENEDEVLKKLHYVNAFGLEELCSFLYKLVNFFARHTRLRLIVIDSISFPFKTGIEAKQRTRVLFKLMAELQRLAVNNQIAVILTNEMSTRVGLSGGSMVGALGDAWAHRCNTRVLLTEHEGTRYAVATKAVIHSGKVARFRITQDGIRDVE